MGNELEVPASGFARRGVASHWLSWLLLLSASVFFSLAVGTGDLVWSELLDGSSMSSTLFWKIRFPRVLAAVAVGASLALVGAVLQSSLRNPLADPFLLGVSSASATGAVCALALGQFELRFPVAVLAALICLVVLDRLSYRKGLFDHHTLLLAGVALTYLLSSVTGLVVTLSDPSKTRGLMFWLMGGFSSVDASSALLTSVVLLSATLYLATLPVELDILATGDEAAHVLGVRPHRLRRKLFLLSSFLVGLSVATAGGIGFVGILVPHLARTLCGVSHRQLLPLCLFGGATLTLLSDTFCRTVFSPREIPVGLLTALLGAPFFLRQLRSGRGW